MASTARRVGFAILGMVGGSIVGGLTGLGAGLAYTTLASTPAFEGQSGFVVAFWILGGIVAGIIAGLIYGMKMARR
jgi:hypothetical protein